MLKIKDDVDLKELEKFGYYEYDDGLNKPHYIYRKYTQSYITIDILKESRTIWLNNDECELPVPVKYITDLIQAGLVKKVEE